MADISAIFFILLIIGVAFPAMLTAWWLLFPIAHCPRPNPRGKDSHANLLDGTCYRRRSSHPRCHFTCASIWSRQIHRLDFACGGVGAFLNRLGRHRRSFGRETCKPRQLLCSERIYPRLRHPRTRRLLPCSRLVLHLAAHAHHGFRRNSLCPAQLDAARENRPHA